MQQRTIFYCKFEPKRTGTHFVSDFPDCLPTTTVPPQKQILHRGPQPRRVNTTTTLLVARAGTQTCSRVHSVCRRRHASHLPALMSLLQSRACTLSAELLPTPSKILPHLWVDTDFLWRVTCHGQSTPRNRFALTPTWNQDTLNPINLLVQTNEIAAISMAQLYECAAVISKTAIFFSYTCLYS